MFSPIKRFPLARGLVLVFSIFYLEQAVAQHIFCRFIGIGCPTLEDKQKERKFCSQQADSHYRKALIEALADPSKWQLGGYDSPEDYANSRSNLIFRYCCKQNC